MRLVLYTDTIRNKNTLLAQTFVVLTPPLGESPFLGGNNLLSSRVLELGTTQSFNKLGLVLVTGTDRHDWLSDVDTTDSSCRLAIGTPHTGLKPISTGT